MRQSHTEADRFVTDHIIMINPACIPSPLVGKVVVVGVVDNVVGVVVCKVVEVVLASHSSRLGCLGPDTLLQCLAPVSRMLQTWSLLL